MESSSKDPDVEVSRTTAVSCSYSRSYPNGTADTVAYCHVTTDACKVPFSIFCGANTQGGANEPRKEKSSAPAYGTNMSNTVSKPVFK